jgi:hypothetical protein
MSEIVEFLDGHGVKDQGETDSRVPDRFAGLIPGLGP